MLQQIEYPDLDCELCTDGEDLMSPPPVTISQFHELEPWDMTLDQCVELTLANSKVMQKLGGAVVSSPAATSTLFDQALRETSPQQSVEAALSAFDAQFDSSFNYGHGERLQNFPPPFDVQNTATDSATFLANIAKTTAAGTNFSYGTRTDYSSGNSPFASTGYDIVNQVQARQPLLRGRGTTVNRIAGPNSIAGNYNGVLIARIRSDISLADFESAVRNLVRDVENNYWELYFAYRDLDTKIDSRESARKTWENRKLRLDNEVGRPDDEALARQQYLSFQLQAQNSLTGLANGQPGVLGAERNLRRLTGLPVHDGRILRPITEPTVAPVAFDWNDSQAHALARRVEIRRQKWTLRQRELELCAARQLNQWDFDLVGQYGFRGFGEDLFGNNSAVSSLHGGDLDDWQLGFEFNGPIGKRVGHLSVRNAELNLVREKTILREQQRQILHDLGAAFTEVDRALQSMKTNFDTRVAVQEELVPKEKRVSEGQDEVFFLLDTQQRAASSESAVHRSIADYNQALLSYAYTTGSLLSRYGIVLTEGPWCEDAQINAREKACRMEMGGPNRDCVDNCPVGEGSWDQTLEGPYAFSGEQSYGDQIYGEQNYESDDDGSDDGNDFGGAEFNDDLNMEFRSTEPRNGGRDNSDIRSIFGEPEYADPVDPRN